MNKEKECTILVEENIEKLHSIKSVAINNISYNYHVIPLRGRPLNIQNPISPQPNSK